MADCTCPLDRDGAVEDCPIHGFGIVQGSRYWQHRNKVAELGDVLRYRGELHEVIGVGEGKHVILAPVNGRSCAQCGNTHHVTVLERAPIFQDYAEPVATLKRAGQDTDRGAGEPRDG